MHLENTVAIVTGASSGIGRQIALALTDYGARLVLTARREEKLNALRDEIHAQEGEAIVVTGDITLAATAEAIVEAALDAFGTINILVNNAGYAPPATLLNTDEELWDVTIDTCLKSVYLMSRAVLPTMQANNHGRIMQVSSVAGKGGYGTRTAYCAAKWGVQGFSAALRDELGDESNIRVQTVNPGAVATEWWDKTGDGQSETVLERMIQPEEIADAIVWMLTQPERLQVNEIVIQTARSPWRDE